MKSLFALTVILLWSLPAYSALDQQEVRYRAVKLYYGLTDGGEAWVRALCWHEQGRDGKRCGHENAVRDRQVYANPCLPEGGSDEAKATRAFLRALQLYVFSDEWHVREFSKFFARFYHAGNAKRNRAYHLRQIEIYRKIRKHITFRNATGYTPCIPCEQPPAPPQ